MTTKRMRYPTKRAWAEAMAAELRREEALARAEYVPASNWRELQRKMRGLEALARDRRRYEGLVERFRDEAA